MTIDGAPVVDTVTGEPAISGTAQVGYTLTADTSAITGIAMPGEFSYQWIVVDGVTETDIDGATSSTYILTSADAGKQIKVRVSFADDAGENQHSHEPGDAGGGGGGRHDQQCDGRREGDRQDRFGPLRAVARRRLGLGRHRAGDGRGFRR